MIQKLFAIKDNVTGSFGKLIECPDSIILKRQISNLLISNNNPYKNFEKDFDLVCLGSFDNLSGIIKNDNELICNLEDLKKNIDVGGSANEHKV